MGRGFARFGLAFAALACARPGVEPPRRVELRQLAGATLELVPAAGQLPYCLVYTQSRSGVLRQLTMNAANRSVACEAGKPVGGARYRVPVEEGPVEVVVLLSDQRLHAGSVSQQLLERQHKRGWSAMELRLPGRVQLDVLEFTPTAEAPATVGGIVGASGMVASEDAGQAAP